MQIHVSPTGNDAADGLAPDGRDDHGPVASLIRARDLARKYREESPGLELEVVVHEGVHRLGETLRLTRKDSGYRGRLFVWRAAEGAEPVLSGAVPITGWRRPAKEPDHLHPDARGKVWVADLPQGVGSTRTLYDGDRRLPRARGEGFARRPPAEDLDPRRHLAFPEGALRNWPDTGQVELVIIPYRTWTMNILPLAEVDDEAGLARTAAPCTYELFPNHRDKNTWVENTLAVLREPGMWCCDAEKGCVYLWPADDEPGEDLAVGALTELVRVEGDIHPENGGDHPARDIEFRGLTFAHGERISWHGRTGGGLQHDWDRHDESTALVRLRGAARCGLVDCTFRDSACGGARMDLYARRNRISGCTFERLGGTGVTLAGYGLGTKDVNRENEIVDCHIHHIGRVYWHSPGIFIWQSGSNRIAHNRIHNTPYTGIVCSGRTHWDRSGEGECSASIRWEEVDALLGGDYERVPWHDPQRWREDWLRREPLMHSRDNRIEYNDIHHVMEIMGDGNGVYVSGAGGGNQVCHNVVHDCPSPSFAEGIRCDDDQHDTLIHGNLVYHLGGMATGITIKGVNAVTNNIIAAPLSESTARGMISLEVGPLHGSIVSRNILYALTPEHRFYAQHRLGCHGEGPEPLLRDCVADDNLYWCASDPSVAEEHLEAEREHGIEQSSRAADPGFVDPENGDFRLRPDSVAFEMGIEPVDPAAAG